LRKLLIHTCCAPCFTYIENDLKINGIKNNEGKIEKVDYTACFYNPTIHPKVEYERRKNAFIEFCKLKEVKNVVLDEYNLNDFTKHVVEEVGENKKYTVRFDSDGGTNVEDQTITENNKANKPADPTKKEYTFEGWYLDDKKYDFDSSVTKDITLKARWKKENTNNNNSSTNKPNNSGQGNNNGSQLSKKEQDNETLKKQLKEKGLVWDANSKSEAYIIIDKWAFAGGYVGEVVESSYGDSDTAYTVKITLNTSLCGGNEILNIDWRNSEPVDFVYYLHSKGYNCTGNTGYHNGKNFHINDKNEIVWD